MKWIKVENRLPEMDVNVLYCNRDKEIFLGQLMSGMEQEIYWSHYDYLEDHDITHWMPLPELPSGMD